MINEQLQTPRRRKIIHDCLSDPRYKYSTVQSHVSKESRPQRQCQHWSKHEKAREKRISSLFKVRKNKLEEITGQNQKIFVRINQQQSYYPSLLSPQKSDKSSLKFNFPQEKVLGPIGNWQPPSHFISGNRGIMCQKNLVIMETTVNRDGRKKLPSLPRLKTPDKQNNFSDFYTPQTMKNQMPTPSRKRQISDLYMMI